MKTSRNIPKYRYVQRKIMEIIQDLSEKNVDKLPGEQELCKQFSCSRITVRHALTLLENDRFIKKVRGSGTYIQNFATNQRSAQAPYLHTIYFILPDLASRFMTKIVHAADRIFSEQGYVLHIALTNYDPRRERALLNDLYRLNAAGILLYPSDQQTWNPSVLHLVKETFPMVFVDRFLPKTPANYVSGSHLRDASTATEYLISNGHRKIGFVSTTPIGTTTVQERLKGYFNALKAQKISPCNRFLCTNLVAYDPEWETIFNRYIDKNSDLTAFLISGSDPGYKFLNVLKQRNLKVPEDVSVVFFDEEYTEILPFMNIQPTRIQQNPEKIGAHSAKLLLDLIRRPLQKPKSIIVSSNFFIGNTVKNIFPPPFA